MPRIRTLLDVLIPVEAFYKEIGGIVGYHYTMLSLMRSEEGDSLERKDYRTIALPDAISHVSRQSMSMCLKGFAPFPVWRSYIL